MRILCLDQASKITGYSVWESGKLVDYGTLEANPKEKDIIVRMRQMYFMCGELIDKVAPDFVAFEGVQFQQNYRTYSQLSQIQGLLMSLLFERKIFFTVVEPTKWRSFCAIRGRKRAEQKKATIQMVKDRFGIEVDDDVADSIGLGIWVRGNVRVEKAKEKGISYGS